jgi:hypothetical protein
VEHLVTFSPLHPQKFFFIFIFCAILQLTWEFNGITSI